MSAEDVQPWFIFWCDVETTGLDPAKDHLLEIYFTLTQFKAPFLPISNASSGHFLLAGPGRDLVLSGGCSEFIARMHCKSALHADLEKPDGSSLFPLGTVEATLLSLSQNWPGVGIDVTTLSDEQRRAVTDSKAVIGGNSAHFDLSFLRVHLPRFASRLSHRIFDVSAMSLLARSLGMPRLPKSERHRAKQDVEESILQARVISSWLDTPSTRRNYDAFSDASYEYARKVWHTSTYGKTAE